MQKTPPTNPNPQIPPLKQTKPNRNKEQKRRAGEGLAAGQGQPTTVLSAEAVGQDSLPAYMPICKQGLDKDNCFAQGNNRKQFAQWEIYRDSNSELNSDFPIRLPDLWNKTITNSMQV